MNTGGLDESSFYVVRKTDVHKNLVYISIRGDRED